MAVLMVSTMKGMPSCGFGPPALSFAARSWSGMGMEAGTTRCRQNLCILPRAVADDDKSTDIASERPEPVTLPSVDKKVQRRAEKERGKNTALITGAISVFLGVAYLLLIQLLDSRGVVLVPPPPEAFGP
eukprot:TRINITY_DN10583_c0_g2_i1.p1 TRINITY_DN10583_c0_g2~~TRINITY_DN10583_c0_g2_i1.p1  ORF type:complete len:130 (+),score=14.78 TRINITY_DN10583_c0_g2_i1:84-473(+)